MECTRTDDLLSAYLDGDLPEREREGFAEHLRHCPRCAGEEKALKVTLSLLRNLSGEKAPPGLFEEVRRRIAQETETVPLWKKLFLPAYIKIPLEAAAVALIFLLAYGIQKEMPETKVPPSSPAKVVTAMKATPAPSASVEGGKAAPGADIQTGQQKDVSSPGRSGDVDDRTVEGKTEPAGPREAAPPETEPGSMPAPPSVKPRVLAKSEIPAGLASRVSTKGGTIEPANPSESPAKESPGSRGFGEQLSRLEMTSPYGKEVTVEVPRNDRAGLEDRITKLALRLGGRVRRGGTFTATRRSGEITIHSEILQVSIPADTEGIFLEELGKMGTIPPEEMTGKTAPSEETPFGTVVYTVRIQIR